MDASILDRPVYDEQLAARVLGIPPSTLHYWLEGGVQRGRTYLPVLRREPTGSREVSWGEFVEARYLCGYRRTLGVRLASLRAFIGYLRDDLGLAYPLAHARPWVGARSHLLVAQAEADLPVELWACVEPHTGVTLLTHPAESYLERIEFDGGGQDGIVVRLRPAGAESPVIIDPEVRFGAPTVSGIPTEGLAELVRAGDSIELVANDFDLPLDEVIAALGYEQLRQRAA